MQALESHFQRVIGVDVQQRQVERFYEAVDKAGLSRDKMRALRGNLLDDNSNYPAEDRAALEAPELYNFDLAVFSMALHHVGDELEMLKRLVERLLPGGSLVVIDWTPGNYRPSIDEAGERRVEEHTQYSYSEERMRELFLAAGCEEGSFRWVVNQETICMPERLSKVAGGTYKKFFLAIGKRRADK